MRASRDGDFFEGMGALVMAGFTAEGYVNSVRKKLIDDWFVKDENGRSKSRKPTEEKVKLILRELATDAGVRGMVLPTLPDLSGDMRYRSLLGVLTFRHTTAHSTEQTVRGEWESPEGEIGLRGLETDWEHLLDNPQQVERLCEDCFSLITSVHEGLYAMCRLSIAPHPNPFISPRSAWGWVQRAEA